MPRFIGKTVDIQKKKEFWQKCYPQMKSWQVLYKNLEMKEAEKLENYLKKKLQCECEFPVAIAEPHSKGWAVYYFHY